MRGNKKPKIRGIKLGTEKGNLSLSLFTKNGEKEPFYIGSDAYDCYEEYMRAVEKYKVKIDFKLISELQKRITNGTKR